MSQHLKITTLILVALLFLSPAVMATDRQPFTVTVEQAYIDLRTGPAHAYPAFYVAQRDQQLEILKRRTHWFKVRLVDSKHRVIYGWVHKSHLEETTVAGSNQLASEHHALKRNYKPLFSGNFALGRLEGSDLIAVQLAYHGLDSLSVELNAGAYTGINNEGWLASGQLLFEPFHRWRVSPFVNAGYGYIKREQNGTLITQSDESDNFLVSGLGFKLRIHKLYRLRFEYQVNNALTSTNDNRELETWQIGLSTYF